MLMDLKEIIVKYKSRISTILPVTYNNSHKQACQEGVTEFFFTKEIFFHNLLTEMQGRIILSRNVSGEWDNEIYKPRTNNINTYCLFTSC